MANLSDVFLLVPPLYFLYTYIKERPNYSVLSLFFLSGGIGVSLKLLFRAVRPVGLDPYAVPSLHAALSSSLFFTIPNVLTLTYAVIVGLLRVLEGYHSLLEVVAGFAVAGFSYLVYKYFKGKLGREADRKSVHMGLALLVGYFGLFFSQISIALLLFLVVVFVTALRDFRPIKDVYSYYAREEKDSGPLTLAFSLLLSSLFGAMPLTGFLLGIGDAFSSLIGKGFGSRPLPWNKEKTVEGLLGGLLGSSIGAYLLRGFYPLETLIVSAVLTSLVESYVRKGDNLVIGVVSTVICIITSGCPS